MRNAMHAVHMTLLLSLSVYMNRVTIVRGCISKTSQNVVVAKMEEKRIATLTNVCFTKISMTNINIKMRNLGLIKLLSMFVAAKKMIFLIMKTKNSR